MYDKLYYKKLCFVRFAKHERGLFPSYLHVACIGPVAVVCYQTAENLRRRLRQTRPSRDTFELFRREEPRYALLFCPF